MHKSTQDVVNHHLEAFGAGSVDGIMEDYAMGSVFISTDGSVLRGPLQIRPMVEQMLAEFAKPGASFSMGPVVVEGDVGYTTWTAETADNVYEFGSDTFVIRDGKIVGHTLAMKATPKG